jgi:TPR repeat protein
VLAARELMLKNFDGRNSDAIVAFARTFDPAFVSAGANPDAKPDIDAAVALYSDAARLGAPEAAEALKRLKP